MWGRILNCAFSNYFFKTNVCSLLNLRNLQFYRTSQRSYQSVALAYNLFDGTSTPTAKPLSPLVIMHGLFGSKQNWRSISKAIQAKTKRKVIAVDARNHGESPHTSEHSYAHLAEDVANFLTEHNIEKAAVLGHSMGGRAMMYFALTHPQVVERAIIVDISPVGSPSNLLEMENIFQAMKTIKVPQSLSMGEGRKLVEKHFQNAAISKETADFILLNLVKMENGSFAWRSNVEALHANFKEIAQFPDSVKTLQYRGPTLFIAGTQSNYIKPTQIDEIRQNFPNANLEMVNCGHNIHIENPSEFGRLVSTFLNDFA